jgi:hypothetical protein
VDSGVKVIPGIAVLEVSRREAGASPRAFEGPLRRSPVAGRKTVLAGVLPSGARIARRGAPL